MLLDKDRKYMVVSAPGGEPKVTDLLIEAAKSSIPECDAAKEVKKRIMEIGEGLGSTPGDLCKTLDAKLEATQDDYYRHEIMAFGEYASARLITEMLAKRGRSVLFIDPLKIGLLAKKENGSYLPDAGCFPNVNAEIEKQLKGMPHNTIVVMGGFYLAAPNGRIVTISRQGSDVSGAALAAIVNASLYENITNEDGLRAANPNIVPGAKKIECITFSETMELAYRGFKLHGDTISYLIGKGIPAHVMNAEAPRKEGTFITAGRYVHPDEYIVGVAAGMRKVPFSLVKPLMNKQVGFLESLTQLLKEMGISIEHVTTGMDSTTVYFDRAYAESHLQANSLMRAANERFGISNATIDQIAIVAAVGLGMKNHVDSEARVLSAIAGAGIKPLMIDFGPPGISMFVGVDEKMAEGAVKAVYKQFF
jgi:aspartate kinase